MDEKIWLIQKHKMWTMVKQYRPLKIKLIVILRNVIFIKHSSKIRWLHFQNSFLRDIDISDKSVWFIYYYV